MTTELTARERRVLYVVLAHQLAHGAPPTFDQLADALDAPFDFALHDQLMGLAARGFLAYAPGQRGSLRVVGVEWHPVFDSTTPAGLLLAELYREIRGVTRTAYLVPAEALSP